MPAAHLYQRVSRRILGSMLTAAALSFTGTAAATTLEPQVRTSRHMTEAIREVIRIDAGMQPTAVAVEPEVKVEDEIKLPDMHVRGSRELKPDDVIVEVPPAPVLGTGVAVIKGRKVTMKIRRLLFLPIGFKLEW